MDKMHCIKMGIMRVIMEKVSVPGCGMTQRELARVMGFKTQSMSHHMLRGGCSVDWYIKTALGMGIDVRVVVDG